MKLAFQSYGSAGEPVIVLHGLFGSRENWHSVCLKLGARFRVFALDQRNHGDSPHAMQMDYRLMAEDVREFLAANQINRAHLLGHSMGAKTAMQLALLYPAEVQSLISVDMAPRAYSPRHQEILNGLLSLKLESYQTRHDMEQNLAHWIPDLATRRFLLKNVRRSGNHFCWRLGLKEIAANYSMLSRAVEGRPYEGSALFLCGVESDYLAEEDLPSIRRLFPKARLHAIPQAGHLVHVENPDVFLREVRSFLTAQS